MSNGRLTFDIPAMRGAAVPVEVRDARGVARSNPLSTAPLEDLQPGQYFVTARLPNGKEFSDVVEVAEGRTTRVVLADDDPEEAVQGDDAGEASIESVGAAASVDVSSSAFAGREAFLRPAQRISTARWSNALHRASPQREDFGGLESLEMESHGAAEPELPAVNLWSGNPLKSDLTSTPLQPPASQDGGLWKIAGTAQPQFVEVSTGSRPNVYVALPAGRDSDGGRSVDCELEIVLKPVLDIRVRLQNAAADVLLCYEAAGMTRQSRELASQSPVWTAEGLLRAKLEDPIAAAVGGYTLLRSGDVERLHDWTANLAAWIEWLPDGLVIYAEHLALLGRHAEAAEQLLQLPSRGLPLFSLGLSMAIGRLRLYTNATMDDERPEQAEGRQGRARELVQSLQPYASVCEFENPLTNFLGRDPLHPSAV